jgi:hypothetical protein
VEEIKTGWIFVSDDDGHDYIIPSDKEEDFYKWVAWTCNECDEYEGETGFVETTDYNKFRCGGAPRRYIFPLPPAGWPEP